MAFEDFDRYEDLDDLPPISLPHVRFPHPEPPEPTFFLPPNYDPEILRVLAVGSRPVVNRFVHWLHRENIAHESEWTRLIPTPNPNEFMRMLTKRVPLTSEDLESL